MTAVEAGQDRLAKLREVLGDMDEALRDEGFDALGSHAVYVRWQRASVEALGAILVEAERELGARVERVCAMFEEAVRKFRDNEALRVEVLLERARREGEADRRRIERMIEAGSNALAMADRASENAGVASAHAQQMVDQSVAGIQARNLEGACGRMPSMADLRTESAASSVRMATGGMGRGWRRGGIHRWSRGDAMVECEGERGAPGHARSARPLLGSAGDGSDGGWKNCRNVSARGFDDEQAELSGQMLAR